MDKIGQVFDDIWSFLDFEVYLLVESSAKHMLPEAVKLVSKKYVILVSKKLI